MNTLPATRVQDTSQTKTNNLLLLNVGDSVVMKATNEKALRVMAAQVGKKYARKLSVLKCADGVLVVTRVSPDDKAKSVEAPTTRPLPRYEHRRLAMAAPVLRDALRAIDDRLRVCGSISVGEAYDSFYQEIVSAALARADGNLSKKISDRSYEFADVFLAEGASA